ncbi:MAG: glycosyltransferase family 2 protein [Prevotellaceae bacterium]|nr:glycosyltransferase family 2 protein [Prevotellaceae bacterium]
MNYYKTSVSVVLPAINETYSLKKTVEIIMNTCCKEDICELLIILCDKSTPECVKTAEYIRQINENVPVGIYYQKEPFIGSAMREAFDLVKGTHVIMMSTDLETDPNIVSEFIELIKNSPEDIITASRWIEDGNFRGYNKVKLILNFIFQKIISWLFFSKLTDLTYAYRIFPVPLVQSINWEETKHPFFLETALKPLRLGVKINEIPAKWNARTEGESQNSFFKNFDYFRVAVKIRFMKKIKILKPV